jgi:hypothetical protein
MAEQAYSIDRPRFFAIAISAITGEVFQIPDIENIQTHKAEDGSSGTWSFTTPLIQEYGAQSGQAQYPRTLPYATVAGPMDLIALFGWRSRVSTTKQGDTVYIEQSPYDALGNSFDFLNYGDSAAATVIKLGKISTCLMIGMVDGAEIDLGFEGSKSSFQCHGRDLTKILEVNDAQVPDVSVAGQAGVGPTQAQPGFFGLSTVALSHAYSGPSFLVPALDLLITKDLTALAKIGSGANANPVSSQVAQSYLAFGFPWRNFIDISALDMSYLPLSANNYPPYTAQMGSVWASLLEIRNPPLSRMFVNEIGQIIFDDSFKAWTSDQIAGIVGPEDIRGFRTSFSDDDMVTFISCVPMQMTGQNKQISYTKGNYSFLPGQGFVNGVMKASTSDSSQVATYGYRYAQFISMYDQTFDDAAKRMKYLLQIHNNFYRATCTIRGTATFRVGQRVQVNIESGWPQSTNAVWYIMAITHSCEWGNDWTTNLELAFPQNSNFGTSYYPS